MVERISGLAKELFPLVTVTVCITVRQLPRIRKSLGVRSSSESLKCGSVSLEVCIFSEEGKSYGQERGGRVDLL